MKHVHVITCLYLLCIVLHTQSKTNNVKNLGWLAGCWASTDIADQEFMSEQWMKPAGGLMLGIGRTVKKEKAVDFEFMRIEEKGDDVFFTAKPKENKEETSFKLIRSAKNEAIFENPDHDFPQRVIYRRQGNKLTGRIVGKNNGKFLGIDFPMRRAKCE